MIISNIFPTKLIHLPIVPVCLFVYFHLGKTFPTASMYIWHLKWQNSSLFTMFNMEKFFINKKIIIQPNRFHFSATFFAWIKCCDNGTKSTSHSHSNNNKNETFWTVSIKIKQQQQKLSSLIRIAELCHIKLDSVYSRSVFFCSVWKKTSKTCCDQKDRSHHH